MKWALWIGGIGVAVGLWIIAGLINDHIDRCLDDYSPAYIKDDAERAAACQ